MLVWSNMDLISLPIAFCGFCSITYISDASSFPRVRMDPLFEKIKWKQKGKVLSDIIPLDHLASFYP